MSTDNSTTPQVSSPFIILSPRNTEYLTGTHSGGSREARRRHCENQFTICMKLQAMQTLNKWPKENGVWEGKLKAHDKRVPGRLTLALMASPIPPRSWKTLPVTQLSCNQGGQAQHLYVTFPHYTLKRRWCISHPLPWITPQLTLHQAGTPSHGYLFRSCLIPQKIWGSVQRCSISKKFKWMLTKMEPGKCNGGKFKATWD